MQILKSHKVIRKIVKHASAFIRGLPRARVAPFTGQHIQDFPN